uniref:DUF834 domain-containing protein n=1 Tax=Oryza brachyantha TaxID=4533 RepID=J3M4X1_ORYBR
MTTAAIATRPSLRRKAPRNAHRAGFGEGEKWVGGGGKGWHKPDRGAHPEARSVAELGVVVGADAGGRGGEGHGRGGREREGGTAGSGFRCLPFVV